MQAQDRYQAGRPRLLRLLADLERPGLCRHTAYLPPGYLGGAGDTGLRADIENVVRQTSSLDTGLAVFLCDDKAVAVSPPFPIEQESLTEGADTAQLVDLLGMEPLVGIVLLRLGRYAVGVVRGDNLVASKSGTRYVKRRHRAGGSSQRRFERSRERLVRELYDKACAVAREVLTPFDGRLDYLLMGGEHHTLLGLVQRCVFLRRMSPITLERRLDVERPGRDALERMPYEVWKSKVVVFTRSEAE